MSCKFFARIVVFEIIFFFLFPHHSMAAVKIDQNEKGIFELWSKDEMVQIAGYGEERLSTVLVTGTIVCDATLNAKLIHSRPISGALVGVSCNDNGKSGSWAQGMTDKYGEFMIDLPSHLHGIPNLHKICSVRVVKLPRNKHSSCRPTTYTMKHHGLKLSSFGNGIRTYTTGEIRFSLSKSLRPRMNVAAGREQIRQISAA